MKKRYLLFRCHGATAQAHASEAAEFIRGYFDLWNKRVNVFIEPMKDRILADDTTPLPWDVFIETANQNRVNVAHAAGWSYLVGTEAREKILQQAEREAIPPIPGKA